VIASGFDARALATDPISGDMFASGAGVPIQRIANPNSDEAKVSDYGPVLSDPAGIAFAPNGTLYAVDAGDLLAIEGTASASPGAWAIVAHVAGADGIAVIQTTNPSVPTLLAVSSNDGSIAEVDPSSSPPRYTPILTGGTRGALMVTGHDGCLYAAQLAGIVKVTAGNGACLFCAPGLPLLAGGRLAVTDPCEDWRAGA
jgi:outer membrane protein assembly factor BamB